MKLIESALQSNGYVIVPEPDGASVRVLTEEAPLAALSESLAVYHDPADLPDGRQLVSFFLDLEHLELSTDLLDEPLQFGVLRGFSRCFGLGIWS